MDEVCALKQRARALCSSSIRVSLTTAVATVLVSLGS
jgi:hypothetical protein